MRCAEAIRRRESVLLVSHIDADGLTSAAILVQAFRGLGIDYRVRFLKQLEVGVLEEIADAGFPLVVFTDLGSGMLDEIERVGLGEVVVADHHRPQGETGFHLNPHLFGFNGSLELSGAGTSYFLARALLRGEGCGGLAGLAVVGAVGDLQHVRNRKLVGVNNLIVEEGVREGVLARGQDLLLFGRQTRPVFKLLQYATDPYLPGITGSEDASIRFLAGLGLRFRGGERWLRWIDLEPGEKRKVVSGLIQHCLKCGVPEEGIRRLVGEVYTLLGEREGTEVRDASEFSTLLNATARYDRAGVGLAVCLGDRGRAYERAQVLLAEHRQNLVEGLNLVREKGVQRLSHVQYFDAGSRIRETIVGIVAGMSFSLVGRNLPILAFADTEGGVKVSARGTQELVSRGLNLAVALGEAARAVGGSGGGHDIAAGALISRSARDEFLERVDEIVGRQLGRKP